jgi:hypothetical protein
MSNRFPPVNKIFDDLDKYRDFCRFEGKVFDERALYNDNDRNWQAYKKYLGYLRAKARNKNFNQRSR